MDDLFTVRGVLDVFFRQRRAFFLVFFASLTLGLLTIVLSTPMYLAAGSLLVKFGSDADAGVNDNNRKNAQISQNDRREIMQSNLDILQSHDLLKAVLVKVGVDNIYPGITDKVGESDIPLEVAIQAMERKHLTIKSSQQSNIIDISVLNLNPKIAAEVVSALQDVFIARQLEIFNKPQTSFLLEQVKQAEESLNKSQKELREFKSSVGISSIEEELNELLKQKSNAMAVALQAVNDAQDKLAELRDKETEMLSTYRSSSPELRAVRKSIEEAERQLQERQDNLKPSSKNGGLSEQTAGISKRISKLEEQRNRYNDLLRQVQVDEENYKNYLARSEEARVNETLGEQKITSVVVVDSPVIPVKPATPRKKLILFSSIIAGILLGGIVVLAREMFDESFRTPKQLAKSLKAPVLASIPSTGVKKEVIAQLFNQIDRLLADVPQPIIQIISSYEEENVDSLAYELSNIAKQQGKQVLLINNDKLRKNFQQAHFEFAGLHNNSWTIISNAGILRDEAGQSIAKLANGSILVVEAERTRAPVAREVIRLIEALGGKVIGTVLMNRKFYIPSKLHSLLYKTDR